MATQVDDMDRKSKPSVLDACLATPKGEPQETKLLLQAFETFTNASTSLEYAFVQLQSHVEKLALELECKNLELEKSLREKQAAQNYLTKILDRLPCGVFVLDETGEVTLCNPIASKILEQAKRASALDEQRFLTAEVRNCLTAAALGEALPQETEITVAQDNGERILATSGTPLHDDAGNRAGTLHIVRDITEMKTLQEQGKRVERLSAMGEMAVELAHEIRNPLGSIELFASLLVRDLSGDLKRWAENIRIGIRSLNTIVSNMLHFARPVPPAFLRVDVHDVIQEVLSFTEPIMQQRQVRLETELNADVSCISGDRELLKQMMLNLIFNAMKAMPSDGSLKIATRNVAAPPGNTGPGAVELQIQDTGIGIPAENLDRIFDPFFTTNKNGTGLGLSVVHQIVERHAGTILVSSEVNRGTAFIIVFATEKE